MRQIKKAIKLIGTQEFVGNILDVSQPVISNWINGINEVPAKYLKKISGLTDHKITVEQLLSDHEKREGL